MRLLIPRFLRILFFHRLRDKTDEVAKVVQKYAESETINRSLATGLTNFCTTLSVIGDYR